MGAAGLAHALRTNWPSRTDQLPASSSLFLPYTHKHAKTHGTPRAGGRGKRRNWSKGNPIVIQAEDGERVKVQRGAGEMPAVHGLGRKSPTPLASTVTHPPPPVSSASPKGSPRNRGSRGSRGRGRGGGGGGGEVAGRDIPQKAEAPAPREAKPPAPLKPVVADEVEEEEELGTHVSSENGAAPGSPTEEVISSDGLSLDQHQEVEMELDQSIQYESEGDNYDDEGETPPPRASTFLSSRHRKATRARCFPRPALPATEPLCDTTTQTT